MPEHDPDMIALDKELEQIRIERDKREAVIAAGLKSDNPAIVAIAASLREKLRHSKHLATRTSDLLVDGAKMRDMTPAEDGAWQELHAQIDKLRIEWKELHGQLETLGATTSNARHTADRIGPMPKNRFADAAGCSERKLVETLGPALEGTRKALYVDLNHANVTPTAAADFRKAFEQYKRDAEAARRKSRQKQVDKRPKKPAPISAHSSAFKRIAKKPGK